MPVYLPYLYIPYLMLRQASVSPSVIDRTLYIADQESYTYIRYLPHVVRYLMHRQQWHFTDTSEMCQTYPQNLDVVQPQFGSSVSSGESRFNRSKHVPRI